MRHALGVCPLAAGIMVATALTTTPARASPVYSLDIFTNNGDYHDDPRVAVELEVSEEAGLARFDFRNQSTLLCVVAQVYFEQGSLDSLESLIEGPGTLFSWPASPPSLCGGNRLVPPFSTWFSAGADPPSADNGVHPGETLAVRFNLADGAAIEDLYDEIESQALRVGVHITGFADGSSESAVTPEPTTVALLLGPAALALAVRRRTRIRQR